MYENRVLRRKTGSKREEGAGDWRRLLDGACSTHGRQEIPTNALLEMLKGRHHSIGLGIGGGIILEWILGKFEWEGVDLIHLARNRDQ
jgi:hypothetical protein